MKQRHQILNDPRFRLVYDEHRPFTEAPAPRHLRLNREGFTLAPGVKKKTQVYPGMLLATHPSMEKGDLHSSVYGVISDINVRSIFIDSADPADLDGSVRDAVVEPFDLLASGLEGDALIEAVKKLGVNTKSIGKKCDVLVINGLNPEPGVAWAEPMLDGHCPEIGAAIKLLRRIGRAGRLILAVPEGTVIDSREFDGIEIAYVEPEYPNSIGELLIKRITGIELPEEIGYRANAETKAILYADRPDLSGWYKADTLAAAIGQSENRITPLQLCVYACTLANQGTRYRATFLKKVISADYQDLLEDVAPEIVSQYPISDTAYDAVIQGMILAATEGSAKTHLLGYPVTVCAKTGTAQHGNGGSDNASLLVFAPAEDPQIAISIYVEKGAQGGNLGSIAVDVMDHYFSQETLNETIPTEGTLN